MIPRDILKKIRQIEIRTNRTVTELAGERARLGRNQRRPRRWLRVARVQTDSLVPRPNVRREGAPNRSRGGCAPRDSAFRVPHSYDSSRNSQKNPPDRNSHESHRDRIGWGARPPRAQPTTPSSLPSRRARANRFACPPGQMFGARARRTAAEAAALPVIPHSAFRVPHSYDSPRYP